MLSPVKMSIPCCPLSSKSMYVFSDSDLTGESNIMDRGLWSNSLNLKNLNDEFIYQKHTAFCFTRLGWTRVVWITCGSLWCFCQLFGHILMAPIHFRESTEEQVILMQKQTHLLTLVMCDSKMLYSIVTSDLFMQLWCDVYVTQAG